MVIIKGDILDMYAMMPIRVPMRSTKTKSSIFMKILANGTVFSSPLEEKIEDDCNLATESQAQKTQIELVKTEMLVREGKRAELRISGPRYQG